MATNGSTSFTSGESSDSSHTGSLQLTYVALATSVVALLLSTLQAILAYLQFDNSEVGRRRCSEDVMGKLWAAQTFRKFKWRDFRYQLFFEVPVFYTAPPGITSGPLTRPKPKSSDGDPRDNGKSIQKIAEKEEMINVQRKFEPIYKITGTKTSCQYTMTDISDKSERWASLHEGCSWLVLLDALQEQEKSSRAWDDTQEKGSSHTICYVMQRRTCCWDSMPLNVTKPYATTTICHLVEMISMLGLVWKDFDMKTPTLSAGGNGYMIKSEYVSGLGILMRFSWLSPPVHEDKRVMPCVEIKRLCFGDVPSIFVENIEVGPDRLENSLKRSLPGLDSRRFMAVGKRSPMFSSTFELIAMVGKSFHIPGSRFRRLPNPCADTWTPGIDIATCLRTYASEVNEVDGERHELVAEIKGMFRFGSMEAPGGQRLADKITKYITAKTALENARSEKYWPSDEARKQQHDKAENDCSMAMITLLDSLHEAVRRVDDVLKTMIEDVREVVALHFATVFDKQGALEKQLASETRSNPKESILVEFYFKYVYSAVAREVVREAGRERDSTISGDSRSVAESDTASDTATLYSRYSPKKGAVWLALMFKMWAWLFLHDFNPEDRMIERTEFKDSRLPVYIG